MDEPGTGRSGRKRRRRRRTPRSAVPSPAANAAPPAAEPARLSPAAAAPARTPPPGGSRPAAQAPPRAARHAAPSASRRPARESPDRDATGEQAWERTHLEQTMFQLARQHAEDAARCAHASPPDPLEEQTHSLVAVLMSYFALEAFISMVGADRLGDRYRYYDRMAPEGKWVEVTRLASKTGTTFAEDGPELRALSALRTWRNMLTHYKGEYEEVEHSGRGGGTRTEALLSAENAARAVEIARMLYRGFYAFDRRSPPRQLIWLNDRPHQPSRPDGASVAARSASARQAEPASDAPHADHEGSREGAAAAPSATPAGAEATAPRSRRRRRRRRR